MASTEDKEVPPDMTASELALVTANEKAGLVSQLACHFCSLPFDVKKTRSLRSHIEEVHVVGDCGFMCGICCEEFTSRKAVENHMSTFHRAPKTLGCGTCGETFRVRNLLLKHIDSHTKEELDNNKVGLCYCGECFEFFETVMSLQAHSATHREQAVYVCGACGLQSQHRHAMVKHLETHVISDILSTSGTTTISGEEVQQTQRMVYQQDPTVIDASRLEVSGKAESPDIPVGGDQEAVEMSVDEQVTSYRCGVCQASFTSLADVLCHTECHGDSTQLVQDLDGEDLTSLLPDTAVVITEAHVE